MEVGKDRNGQEEEERENRGRDSITEKKYSTEKQLVWREKEQKRMHKAPLRKI